MLEKLISDLNDIGINVYMQDDPEIAAVRIMVCYKKAYKSGLIRYPENNREEFLVFVINLLADDLLKEDEVNV